MRLALPLEITTKRGRGANGRRLIRSLSGSKIGADDELSSHPALGKLPRGEDGADVESKICIIVVVYYTRFHMYDLVVAVAAVVGR